MNIYMCEKHEEFHMSEGQAIQATSELNAIGEAVWKYGECSESGMFHVREYVNPFPVAKTIEITLTHDELLSILNNMRMSIETAHSESAGVKYVEVQNKLKSAERQTRG